MKKLTIISCIALAVLGMNSCTENFLTVESASQLLADGTYYNSKGHLTEALVASYDPLKWYDYFYSYESLPFVSDLMSEDVMTGGGGVTDCLYLHNIANFSALPTSVCNQSWTISYSGVNRCNIVLQYINNATDMTDAEKKEYIAEATVMREWYYTILWKYWGNIPYYETNLSSPYICDQSGHDAVYEKIASTLEGIINGNSLPMKAASGSEGHVTQAMAEMLYADVVMYQSDKNRYATALKYMKDIIGSGKYDLVADFASMWESTGEWGKESIFEINYTSTSGSRSWGSPIATGGSVYPKLIGINSLSGSPDFNGGWGFEPVSAKAYALFDAADKRRDASILNFTSYAASTGASYSPRYEDTGYFLRKYLPRTNGNKGYTGDGDMNYNNNIRLYRYAETLLNAAELLLQTGGSTSEAQGYLDKVRTRAGLPSVTVSIDNILDERHKEFVGEGKRYWDLVRSGKAASVLTAGSTLTRTVGWTTNKKYLPIPQTEIDAAQGTLKQNSY
ncbi:MAG: RagB/SusD family nutrient uptake outer membrane protein [Bacteroidota bacterium]|nr:RagB/SusD family nutrient uptake outer membrane protein [Bacteroidota bacterium]